MSKWSENRSLFKELLLITRELESLLVSVEQFPSNKGGLPQTNFAQQYRQVKSILTSITLIMAESSLLTANIIDIANWADINREETMIVAEKVVTVTEATVNAAKEIVPIAHLIREEAGVNENRNIKKRFVVEPQPIFFFD